MNSIFNVVILALISWHVDGLCNDGSVRLVDGPARTEGRLEVCYSEVWGRVCDSSWSNLEASVVCKQLGYQGGVPYNDGYFGLGSGPVHLSDVQCLGTEVNLAGCQHDAIDAFADCYYTSDVGVSCYNQTKDGCREGSLRLVGGKESGIDGRLEVCLNDQWGTVCGKNWNDMNTKIACRQLNAAFSGGMVSTAFSSATSPILLRDASCLGNELTFMGCEHYVVGDQSPNFCNHNDDVGLKCWKNASNNQIPYPYLLVTTNAGILKMDMDGTNLSLVVPPTDPGVSLAYGLDYNIRNNSLYWSSYSSYTVPIWRSRLDGSFMSPMLDVACIAGISQDWLNRRLFWTNFCDGGIHMYDLSNGTDTLLFKSTQPNDVAVDPINGFLFWSSQTPGMIERGALIGGSRETLHSTDLQCVLSISLDIASDRLLWNDFCLLKIEMSFTNGSHRTTLLAPVNAYGMALFLGTLYWTERSDLDQIHSVKSLVIGSQGAVTTIANFSIEPIKIRVVELSTQPLAGPLKLNCSSVALGGLLQVNCSANHALKSLSCSVQNRTIGQCKLPLAIDLSSQNSTTVTVLISATDVYQSSSIFTLLYTKPTPFVRLINNTPRIKGGSVSFDVVASQPITSMFCQITNHPKKNCSQGQYMVTALQPGPYTFTAEARTADGQTAASARNLVIAQRSSDCVLVLTNDGITVNEDFTMVEFASTGSPKVFICIIDKRSIYPCTSPLKLNGLGTGTHTLMVGSVGCAGDSPVMVQTFVVP